MKALLCGLLVVLPLGGCAVRTDFIPANGKHLSVHDKIEAVSDTESVAVGELRNNSGDVIATQYANRQVTRFERVVYGKQGEDRVDDESFFRIVKDEEAIKKYDDYHASGRTMSFVASGMLFGGIALFGGSMFLLVGSDAVNGAPEPCSTCDAGLKYPLNNLGYLAIGSMVVTTMVAIAGGIVLPRAAEQARTKNAHLYDVEERAKRMKPSAERYNETLAPEPTTEPAREPPRAEPPPVDSKKKGPSRRQFGPRGAR